MSSTVYLLAAAFVVSIGLGVGCYIKAGMFARVEPGEHDPSRIWIIAALCWVVAALVCLVALVVGASRQEPDRGVEVGWTTTATSSS